MHLCCRIRSRNVSLRYCLRQDFPVWLSQKPWRNEYNTVGFMRAELLQWQGHDVSKHVANRACLHSFALLCAQLLGEPHSVICAAWCRSFSLEHWHSCFARHRPEPPSRDFMIFMGFHVPRLWRPLLSMAGRRSGQRGPRWSPTRRFPCLTCLHKEMSDFEPVTPGPAFQVGAGGGGRRKGGRTA